MLHPALDETQVARERELQLEDIRTRDDSPAGSAFSLFLGSLYDAHPYRLEMSGQADVVAGLTGESLRSHLHAMYRREGLVLAVTGDVDPEHIRGMLADRLAEVGGGARAWTQPLVESELSSPRRVSKRLDRRQAHLVMGVRGTTLRSVDRSAAQLIAAVLDGQGGRLFVELRDRRSLAYTVTAMSADGIDPGYFAVYIGTSPEKVAEAREGIVTELRRICDDLVPEEELERARSQLIGAHERGLQRQSARAGILALDTCYGLGPDWHLGHSDRLRAVTPDALRETARRLLNFDRMVEALVSPDA